MQDCEEIDLFRDLHPEKEIQQAPFKVHGVHPSLPHFFFFFRFPYFPCLVHFYEAVLSADICGRVQFLIYGIVLFHAKNNLVLVFFCDQIFFVTKFFLQHLIACDSRKKTRYRHGILRFSEWDCR
jgi:hypothetical protein